MSIYDGENTLLAKRARRCWGDDDTLRSTAEEATELSLAAQHHRRRATPETKAALAVEIADLEIVIKRAKLLFDSEEDSRLLWRACERQRTKYTKAIEAAEQVLFERGELSDRGESKL